MIFLANVVKCPEVGHVVLFFCCKSVYKAFSKFPYFVSLFFRAERRLRPVRHTSLFPLFYIKRVAVPFEYDIFSGSIDGERDILSLLR